MRLLLILLLLVHVASYAQPVSLWKNKDVFTVDPTFLHYDAANARLLTCVGLTLSEWDTSADTVVRTHTIEQVAAYSLADIITCDTDSTFVVISKERHLRFRISDFSLIRETALPWGDQQWIDTFGRIGIRRQNNRTSHFFDITTGDVLSSVVYNVIEPPQCFDPQRKVIYYGSGMSMGMDGKVRQLASFPAGAIYRMICAPDHKLLIFHGIHVPGGGYSQRLCIYDPDRQLVTDSIFIANTKSVDAASLLFVNDTSFIIHIRPSTVARLHYPSLHVGAYLPTTAGGGIQKVVPLASDIPLLYTTDRSVLELDATTTPLAAHPLLASRRAITSATQLYDGRLVFASAQVPPTVTNTADGTPMGYLWPASSRVGTMKATSIIGAATTPAVAVGLGNGFAMVSTTDTTIRCEWKGQNDKQYVCNAMCPTWIADDASTVNLTYFLGALGRTGMTEYGGTAVRLHSALPCVGALYSTMSRDDPEFIESRTGLSNLHTSANGITTIIGITDRQQSWLVFTQPSKTKRVLPGVSRGSWQPTVCDALSTTRSACGGSRRTIPPITRKSHWESVISLYSGCRDRIS